MYETMQPPLLASILRKRIFSVLYYTESAWFVITRSLDGWLIKFFFDESSNQIEVSDIILISVICKWEFSELLRSH